MPVQRVRGGHKAIGSGNDFACDAQRLQCGDECQGAVSEQSHMLNAQVLRQGVLQLLMKRATVREDLVVPDLLQIGCELFQRGKVGLGDVNRIVRHV